MRPWPAGPVHYIALHLSDMGQRFNGRQALSVTGDAPIVCFDCPFQRHRWAAGAGRARAYHAVTGLMRPASLMTASISPNEAAPACSRELVRQLRDEVRFAV